MKIRIKKKKEIGTIIEKDSTNNLKILEIYGNHTEEENLGVVKVKKLVSSNLKVKIEGTSASYCDWER